MCEGLVAYYRVSTAKQGRSGFGLEAQQKAVSDYAASVGIPVLKEHTEIESGKNDERRELQEALKHCELTNSRLVIAKLDRLSRNVGFIATLQESRVKFVCCDMPEANEAMVQIMAVMAQAERKQISKRTKEALAAAKKRGVKLGNPNLAAARAARKNGNDMNKATAVRSAKADDYAAKIAEEITKFDPRGDTSYAEIARHLNSLNIKSPRGKTWTSAAVKRVTRRAKLPRAFELFQEAIATK